MIKFIKSTIYIIFFLTLPFNGANNNCKLSIDEPASHCLNYEKTIKSERDKLAILDKINNRRNKVASGELHSLPSAERMQKMEWNKDLEHSAQRWANQCVKSSVLDIKDTCLDFGDMFVGQNIATVRGDAPGLTPTVLVDMWYIELLNLNASVISNYRSSVESELLHYSYFTQLVWAESNQVGCGGVKFKENDVKKNTTIYRLVCNFAPRGNLEGAPVYTTGAPCTRCTSNTCDSTYGALCSSLSPFYDTTMTPTKELNITAVPTTVSNNILTNTAHAKITELFTSKDFKESSETKLSVEGDIADDDTIYNPYNYVTNLHKYNTIPPLIVTKNQIPCNAVSAVDDIVELLKNKLLNDPLFKEVLLTTKLPIFDIISESNLTDASVAAFVKRIYSKKEPSTTTKLPESDYVNSTLLVDLVEAVIFRNGADKQIVPEEIKYSTESEFEVSPVRIQAELAEVKHNNEFAGHYFFPEDIDEGETTTVTAESYYDLSESQTSDVVFEIEGIKRNKASKNFLDEILESDTVTEGTTEFSMLSSTNIKNYFKSGQNNMKKFLNVIGERNTK